MSTRRPGVGTWLAVLALAGCAAAPDPAARERPRPPSDAPTSVVVVDGPIYVAPPRYERAVEAAREARWPLPAAAEVELAEITARWRAAVRRALFAHGLELAAAPADGVWILELELLHLAPSAAWLNAAGAEDRATAADALPLGFAESYVLRSPEGKQELPYGRSLGPLAGKRDESWSRAGERELLAGVAAFAARVRAAGSAGQ